MSDQRILLGEITGVHGIRGEVLVRAYTAEPEAIASYGPLTDATGTAPLTIKVVRLTPKGAIVARIKGVTDRNGAEALKGRKLFVARETMPAPDDEDEFYHADLIGLAAIDAEGSALGEVIAVQNYGAGDLLEIRLAGTTRTEFIPFTKAVVPDIDIAARRMTVVRPEEVVGEPRDGTSGATGPHQGWDEAD
ncbi:MAG: ribosome maturation factor RimM [Hyphomicrobiaceae bacterium]|nr:ribosome maturation factor RimM [Hyphomicrobiaceae bacterium]MCC0007362.1 ribosome maturation factor RimM [Hyphomicrobiaceae bacterium]